MPEITLGGQTFIVGGLTLGTLRRVPSAMPTMFEFKEVAQRGGMPTPDFLVSKMDVFAALIHDVVQAEPQNPRVTLDDINALMNGADAFRALGEVSEAIAVIFSGVKPVPDELKKADSGNAPSL